MRGYNEYIGARYVPIFDGDWDNTKEYEPLTVVSYQGNSYTSKIFVPKNAPINDTKYWALTGNYNAQVEAYRNEVASLSTEVLKFAIEEGSTLHLFPSLANASATGNTSLMVNKNHAVLFDAGDYDDKTVILAYYNQLFNDGVFSNIDTIIISHYHHDHVGLLADILTAFPHDNCKAFIAMNPSGYYTGTGASTLVSQYETVKSILETANVQYTEVTSNRVEELENSNISIELFNSNASDYTYYSGNTTEYNDYSMVALVKIGEIYAMYPGDIQKVAQERIINSRTLPKLFLYSAHHHGSQNDDNLTYLNSISPEYTVLQTGYNQLNINRLSMVGNYASDKVVSCAYSSIEVAMDKVSGSLIHGTLLPRVGYVRSGIEFYVNNEYQGTIHDGTKEHPFTSIDECNSFIKDERNLSYIINVAPTNTIYTGMSYLRNYNCELTIQTTPNDDSLRAKVGAFNISQCSDITLSNLEFVEQNTSGGYTRNMYITYSTVNIESCIIDGAYNDTPAQNNDAIRGQLSTIYISSSTIKNVSNAFSAGRYMNVITYALSFDNVGACYPINLIQFVIRGIDTVNAVTAYISTTSSNFNMPVTIGNIPYNQLSALKALIALNTDGAISEEFRYDKQTYQIVGKTLTGDSLSDLDDAIENGNYRYTSSSANRPSSVIAGGGSLIVTKFNSKFYTQLAFGNDEGIVKIAIRKHTENGGWSDWYGIDGVLPQ